MSPPPSTTSTPRPRSPVPACPAQALAPGQRQRLALDALAGRQPVTPLAQQHEVRRQFVSQPADQAHQALAPALAPARDDQGVLLSLPVPKALLRPLVRGLLLRCPRSCRAAVEFLRDLLD